MLTQRCKKPAILPTQISLLQRLLHRLFCLLPLAHFGERLVCDDSFETFQFERVTCWHDVVVVDNLDERLHLAALVLSGFAHATGDLQRVALDTSHERMRERVLFATVVLRLNDDDLLAGISSAGDDGLDECG